MIDIITLYKSGQRSFEDANLVGADLEGADLRGANLVGADLKRTNLRGAYLWGANLWGANLEGTNLRGAKNISAIYVPGMSARGDYLYAVQHKDALMIKAGCWWGTIDEFEARVKEVKGEGHLYLLASAFLRAVIKDNQ